MNTLLLALKLACLLAYLFIMRGKDKKRVMHTALIFLVICGVCESIVKIVASQTGENKILLSLGFLFLVMAAALLLYKSHLIKKPVNDTMPVLAVNSGLALLNLGVNLFIEDSGFLTAALGLCSLFIMLGVTYYLSENRQKNISKAETGVEVKLGEASEAEDIEWTDEDRFPSTGNTAWDRLLTKYDLYCEKKDIQLLPYVDGSGWEKIQTADLVTIVCCALKNAIEATEHLEPRERRQIRIKARCLNGCLAASIENPYEHSLKENKGVLLSTKEGNDGYGSGLYAIGQAVRKYNGDVQIEARNKHFLLTIVFPECNLLK